MGSNCFLQSLILLAAVHFSTPWVPAEGSPGSDFLDEKEIQATFLKQAAEKIHDRQCELLASCGATVNCSRNSCWPLVGDVDHLTYQEVKNNTYCPAATGTCQSKNSDFTRSYILKDCTTCRHSSCGVSGTTFCSQRELDAAFRRVCNESSLSRAFFGTVGDTSIHFPGSDQSLEDWNQLSLHTWMLW